MTMDRKCFGVIGVGTWGDLHVQTYQDHPLAEAVAVCDATPGRADEVAKKWNVPKVCKDYQELIQLPEVDAVSVVTPDFVHTEIVVAALEAGKDVLVEKPLATTLEECERIEAAVERTGRKLMVDFHTRWSPHFFKAREAIVEDKIGKPRYVYYRLSDVLWVPVSMISWAGRSSVLWFLGSHCIDTLRWMLQDEVERVYSVSRSEVLKSKGVDTYDFVVSILEFRGGCVVTLENCWILPDGEPSIVDINCQIVGDAGRILIDGSHHRTLQRYTSKEGKYPDVLVMPEIYGRPTGFAVESIRYFVECVVQDIQPITGVKDGIAATKVLLAIEQSAREGNPVNV